MPMLFFGHWFRSALNPLRQRPSAKSNAAAGNPNHRQAIFRNKMVDGTFAEIKKSSCLLHSPKPVHFVGDRFNFHRRHPLETLDVPFHRGFLLVFDLLGFTALAGPEFHENSAIISLLARLAARAVHVALERRLEIFTGVPASIRFLNPKLSR